MSVLVIGSSNVDISVFVDHLPQKGETLLGKSMQTSFGGKGANQAVACAKLGAKTTFLSALGDDDYAQAILTYLNSLNIETKFIKKSTSQPTGTAIISVDEQGQNTIVVISGANMECDVEYLKANDELFKTHDYILLQMEIPLDAIEYAIGRAKELGKTVILNPAPANPDLDPSILGLVDYFTPNEHELVMMAKSSDFDESVLILRELGVRNLLVTLGDKGSRLINESEDTILESYKVKAIDTVGAGDCFNGAFVSALDRKMNVIEAIKFANKASSIAVTRPGAQESIPILDEIEF